MGLYQLSSVDPSLGVAKRLLQNWRSHYPEYPTTANALMKRVRTLKKHETAQVPMAGSVAATEREESSLPTISVPGDMEKDGPNITSSDISDTGMPREDPGSTKWRGVRVDADRHAAIDQWMKGVKPKTPLEVNCMVYASAVSLRPP